jgi:hypothetical protein
VGRCLLDDRQALTVYLRLPREHWQRIRQDLRRVAAFLPQSDQATGLVEIHQAQREGAAAPAGGFGV